MTNRTHFLLSSAFAALALSACMPMQAEVQSVAAEPVAAAPTELADISALFSDYDAAQLAMSPMGKAYRGVRDGDYSKWGDFSDTADVKQEELQQSTVQKMRETYDLAKLSDEDALSYRLFDAQAKRSAERFKYRNYGYIFDQMNGAQSGLPAFLINIHRVSNLDEAAAYVDRIDGLGAAMDTLTAQSKERADEGVMPPDWVYPYVISDIENLLSAGDNNAILLDFDAKLTALNPLAADAADLMAQAENSWNDAARPAYERLLTEMKRQQAIAPTDDGIWRFPEGAAYYKALLANYTTTDLTADEIHNIGLREVDRIHGEMRTIMKQVGFEGTLQEFFDYTRTGEQFFYTNREDYLAAVQEKL
ncbi:MAG: DUF885 domain-containing protein, partial [Pontixanthobacter sp.]